MQTLIDQLIENLELFVRGGPRNLVVWDLGTRDQSTSRYEAIASPATSS
jgi:hypothetical protein